jgi:hypothetical protein
MYGFNYFVNFRGYVAQIGWWSDCPFYQTDLSHDLRDGDAEGGVAFEDANTDLELRDLTVKVPRHETLAQQFHTMHLGFDAASAVVSAPSIARQAHPKDAAERGRQSARPRYFDARRASLRATASVALALSTLDSKVTFPFKPLFTTSSARAVANFSAVKNATSTDR